MTYSGKANPNATNSELDAKVIKPFVQLTNTQRDELVEQFVEMQVDSMDTKTMMEWITDELIHQYGQLTPLEIRERVDCYDDELYDELVENIQVETLMKENNDKAWEYAQCVDHMVDSMEETV